MDDLSTGVTLATPATDRPFVSPSSPSTGALFLWLAIQLLALLLPALRVPLAAKYPAPAELNAVAVVLAAQVGAGALLFPTLMPEWRTAAAVIAIVLPFQTLAALLAAVPPSHVVEPGAYVVTWLASLALWRAALRLTAARLWLVAVASAVSVGGATLWYLRSDFVSEDGADPHLFGPLTNVLPTSLGSRPLALGWAWPLGSLAAAALALTYFRATRRRPLAVKDLP